MVSLNTVFLRIAACYFATLFIVLGLQAFLGPAYTLLTFLEFPEPATAADRRVVDSLMYVYGAREVFKGVTIYAATLAGSKNSLAVILIAAGWVAFSDGAVCFAEGQGHWHHWCYATLVTAVGALLLY